jgi:hypothetical protein
MGAIEYSFATVSVNGDTFENTHNFFMTFSPHQVIAAEWISIGQSYASATE